MLPTLPACMVAKTSRKALPNTKPQALIILGAHVGRPRAQRQHVSAAVCNCRAERHWLKHRRVHQAQAPVLHGAARHLRRAQL